MKVLLVLAALVLFLLWYALKGRAWLKTKPWAFGFFDWIETIEIALYKKSETILVGRLLWVGSALVTFHDSIAALATSLNWTPITARLLADVPEDLRGFILTASLGVIGLVINWLRKRTSRPLELVAVPQAAITPQVAEAIVAADVAKQEAVAVVKEAQAA